MKVQIEISKSVLASLDLLSAPYVIVDGNVDLRNNLLSDTSINELNSCDQDEIVTTALKAISLGTEYGIDVDIELGRNPVNDARSYTLIKVGVVAADGADYSVRDLIK